MHDLTAKRTLVKSPPELWSEVSEVERLARHLGAFGEITITKLEPEHTVAWEGEGASGTVSIEPAGWGTKVTLRAQLEGAAVEEPGPAPPGIEASQGEEAAVEDVGVAEPGPAPPTIEAAGGEEAAVEGAAVEEPGPAPPGIDASAREGAAEIEDRDASPPAEPEQRRKRGFFARLFGRRAPSPAPVEHAVAPETAGQAVAEPIATEAAAERPAVEEPPRAEEAAAEEPAAEEPPVPEEPAAEEPPTEAPGLAQPPPGAQDGEASLNPEHAQAILDEALDRLGSAHHRPFSRG
jgi:hypothetical protein